MSKLIEALQIFLKYGNTEWPTICDHDILMVCISPEVVSAEDTARLGELNFFPSEEEDYFYSHHFGSA